MLRVFRTKRMALAFSQVLMLSLACVYSGFVAAEPAKKPNIIWLVSEDNSSHYLKHFFKNGTETPNISKLAEQGVTFTNVTSNGAVCSVARTTLATGVYTPRIAAQFHRAYKEVSLPEGWKLTHQYLQEAGYFTSNHSKTDYNLNLDDIKTWDVKGDWRKRESKDQPFFHMDLMFVSHESRLHPGYLKKMKISDGEKAGVELPPYLPDNDVQRKHFAGYLQRIQSFDKKVGKTMAALKKEGLLDDTFIFYFSDHGGVLPRSKGFVYDSGSRTPLVVHVPKNFKHLVDFGDNSEVDAGLQFVDISATTLKLAGVEVPKHMDGKPFLGKGVTAKDVNARQITFQHGDRFDDKIEMVRAMKKGKYQYVRSYQGYLPDGLYGSYRYIMDAYKDLRTQHNKGTLNATQELFFQPKPAEQLFDTEADPHQVKNLAGNKKYASIVKEMREELTEELTGWADTGFYPESYLAKYALKDVLKFTASHKAEIAKLIKVANLQLLDFKQAKPSLEKALKGSEFEQMWALISLAYFGDEAKGFQPQAKDLLQSPSQYVRHHAATFLVATGDKSANAELVKLLNGTNEGIFATEVLNSIIYLKDFKPDYYDISFKQLKPKTSDYEPTDGKKSNKNYGVKESMNYLKKSA